MVDERIRLLFDPESIAIVGASSNLEKASGYPLRNLLLSNFTGRIFPINPRVREIKGVKCYPSILDLPDVPDVAIVMLDSTLVSQAVDECGRKGVRAVVVGAAGFSEAGEDGRKRQAALAAVAKQHGIRICGPNGHGVYNVIKGVPLGYNFSFALRLLPGPVAIASQSGALLGSLATRTLRMGQGLSYLVSSGNEVDLDLCDYLEFFLEDETTKVIALLIEGLKDGAPFLDLLCKAHQVGKAVVVLKVGKSERGAITTMAHTSRMAGSAEIYEAAFRQFGVISTDTVEAFLGAAQMAANQPPPQSGKLMVLTSTGAGASLMADKAKEYGIELADISEETRTRIPSRRSAILANPFDTAGQSRSPGFLPTVCDAFASDLANDCLLLLLGPLAVRHQYAVSFCEAVKRYRKAAAAIVSLTEEEMEEVFRQHHIPLFDSSTDACFRVLRSFIQYGQFCARQHAGLRERNHHPQFRSSVEKIFKACEHRPALPDSTTRELLGEYGLSTPSYAVAWSYNGAREAAGKIRFPVILKGILPNLAHKNEAGMVSRRISNETELKREYDSIHQKARAFAGGLEPVEVIVEKYIAHDYEVIIGVKYDAVFGPVVLFGLGGVFTEVLRDYSLRLAPLTATEALDMVSDLKAFPVFERAASQGVLDLNLLVEAITKVSDLAVDLNGRIAALDINPMALVSVPPGIMVLDAKIHLCISEPGSEDVMRGKAVL